VTLLVVGLSCGAFGLVPRFRNRSRADGIFPIDINELGMQDRTLTRVVLTFKMIKLLGSPVGFDSTVLHGWSDLDAVRVTTISELVDTGCM